MAVSNSLATNPDILAMGDLVYDVMVYSEEEELSLESDITASIMVRPGGSAANFAVQAARLLGRRGQVGFISKVGQDDSGLTLVQSLRREGVQTHVAIAEEGKPSGTVLVFVNRSGRRTMVTDPGASRTITLDEVNQRADIITSCRAFHLTSYFLFTNPPRPAALHACQLAKSAGSIVSLDPSSHHLIELIGIEQYTSFAQATAADIFFPNLDEGLLLTAESEPSAMALALHRYAPIVALKMGADGCLVSQQGGTLQHIPAVKVKCVDSTGAGDAFAAGFIICYLQTRDVLAAGRQANEVAAQVVARPGAR